MVSFGGISSLFDFITFAFLLFVVSATEPVFQTAWFVLSLVTELGILFVARTRRPAWMSRPGSLLIWCSIAVAIVAFALPWMPFAGWMGFVPLPADVLIGLVAIALGYFISSEALKRWLFPHKGAESRRGSAHARHDRG
jgi:Mg2+-importing ATPase